MQMEVGAYYQWTIVNKMDEHEHDAMNSRDENIFEWRRLAPRLG